MPLILPGNVASATAATTYTVANSCRFNADANMIGTFGTPTDLDKWTVSFWCKRAFNGSSQYVFEGYESGNQSSIYFDSNEKLHFGNKTGGSWNSLLLTNRVFRDPSAWYHIVCVWDSDNGTAGDRMKMYVNGVEETSFATDTNPSSGQASHVASGANASIGVHSTSSTRFAGYLAEVCFIDGQALTPTSFGEFDSDSPTIWKPIDVSGLTFGNNGFYLDFEDSSNLGNVAAGSLGDLTETSLAATDSATDTPTNNFCVMNPLDSYWAGATFSQGNCKVVFSAPLSGFKLGTFGLTSGKWYFEAKILTNPGSYGMGIADHVQLVASTTLGYGTYQWQYRQTGVYDNSGSGTSYGNSYTNGDIVACAFDLDNNRIYWAKAGTWQASSDPTDGTNAVAITDPASGPKDGCYYPSVADWDDVAGGDIWEVNFGGCSSFTVSSGNADDNGYGNFEYDVPAGYYAICSKNVGEFGG
jgi:hypothetical protein